MATATEAAAAKVISDVGKRLAQQTRLNKDSLVKLLRKAEDAFPALGQSSALKSAIDPLSDSLVRHNLLQHKDKDVRVLVASCFSQIIRVLAPDPPYSDEILREIFKLMVSMFVELSDTTSPYFTRRVKILETVARLKCCLLMLDIGCDDLVLEMFTVFFSVVREQHQPSLRQAMVSIMTLILDEKVSQPLLDVILRNLLNAEKATPSPSASMELAVSIIQHCTEKLEPLVRGFLTSCILDRDAVTSDLKECYHDIIFEVFQCAPQMLLAVIPNLTQELLIDQVDVRIKAVNFLGKLFALPGHHVAHEYRHLFVEFLKRFSDKSAEVRISALQCAIACYMSNPSGSESREVIAALEGRLLDFDDKVRMQAVTTLCDLAMSNMKGFQADLISRVTERLRDKKVSVRKGAMQKLLELYRVYCRKCSDGLLSEHFEHIPCRILMLCYDKDCKEFRPHNMELVLAEDLFPADLSVKQRTKHWIFLFSQFTVAHTKVLNSILSQKWRLQTEMQAYLALRKKEKENSLEEVQKRLKTSFMKMSASFSDPSNAEECFQKLNQMKDNSIFKDLLQLLNGGTDFETSSTIRDTLLKNIGTKHPLHDFLRILSAKCSFNIFCSENVLCILSDLPRKSVGNKDLETSSVNLLMTVVSIFPSLLRGSEELLQTLLLEENNPLNEIILQILAKAGSHISIKLSDIYSPLEKICLEGTRAQSKYAISAIVALNGTSYKLVFSDLYEKLVDSLRDGQNVPTVLQSLACIAQYSISTYESREEEISFIIQKIFQNSHVQSFTELAPSPSDKDTGCSSFCKLKIYGIITLVKSFLPHEGTHVRHQIKKFFNILLKILVHGDTSDDVISSTSDKANIRLAAAKAVLQLARKWDLHIPPRIFQLAILKARDSSSFVRRLFLEKIHKLLKERAIPSRYACAFALAASDCFNDVQVDVNLSQSLKYMTEFIKEHSKDARIRQTSEIQDVGGAMTTYPEYIVVFLIHVLAHDVGFPSENCQDEDIYARFCSPLVVVLQALVTASSVDSSPNVVDETSSYMLSVFRAIRMAEDAVDVCVTPKLHILAGIGMLILKALSCTGMSASRTPGFILLPSSLYRVRFDQKSDEANPNCLTGLPFDEKFNERILQLFESHIAQRPTSPPAKRGRKLQENSFQLDGAKRNEVNLPLPKQIDLPRSRKKEKENSHVQGMETHETVREQVGARNKNKRPSSATGARSIEMHHESSAASDHKQRTIEITETNLGKDRLSSSCGSVITKPSLSESQVSSQDVNLTDSTPLEVNDRKKTASGTATELPKVPYITLKNCNSKELGDMREMLIGQRIKLWSPIDKCYFSGTVDEFNSQNSSHKITYDSGEIEMLCLTNENCEIISDGSSPKEEGVQVHPEHRKCHDLCGQSESSYSDPTLNSSISCIKLTDAFGKATQQRTALSTNYDDGRGTIPSVAGAAKGKKKGHKLVSSSSDVVNVNEDIIARRTRSRKS